MREIDPALREFCQDFLKNPYCARTEHGLHAQFFTQLYNALPEPERYFEWQNQIICKIQKEYPTATALGKPRRQNWDISVIKTPPEFFPGKELEYDYFRLTAAIEFGMNATKEHLVEDIRRLNHEKSNEEKKYVVHIYRLSKRFSSRDWSSKSKRILTLEEIEDCQDGDVEIHFVQFDSTGTHENGYWHITKHNTTRVK